MLEESKKISVEVEEDKNLDAADELKLEKDIKENATPVDPEKDVTNDTTALGTNDNMENLPTESDDALEERYKLLIRSLCVDIACAVHRQIKTGQIPLSQMSALPRNSKDSSDQSFKRPRSLIVEPSTGLFEPKKPETEMRRTRGQGGVDAWGRIPPKDTLTKCRQCGKELSITRFASHLAKCLGVVKSRSRSCSQG